MSKLSCAARAAPFKVWLGFLFVQCPPAFEAVFRSSSCLKSRTWTKKELSCVQWLSTFVCTRSSHRGKKNSPSLMHHTLLYSTTWMHFTVLLETDSSSTLELNFCRRLYPHDLHATRIFLSGFHFNPPCAILLHPSRLNFYAHSSLSLFSVPRLSSRKLHLQLCSFYSLPQFGCKCWPMAKMIVKIRRHAWHDDDIEPFWLEMATVKRK